jgi:hypothetical protein
VRHVLPEGEFRPIGRDFSVKWTEFAALCNALRRKEDALPHFLMRVLTVTHQPG